LKWIRLANFGGEDVKNPMTGWIISNTKVQSSYYHLIVEQPEIAVKAKPGQFVMIRVAPGDTTDPLLRRPISIMNADSGSGEVELLYKIAGRGTYLLSKKCNGERIDILGPLGNGFPELLKPHHAMLVGGGVGIPPLVFLADNLRKRSDVKLTVFIGAKTADELIGIEKFGLLGARVLCATESGEIGFRGFVTRPLIEYLKSHPDDKQIIYACGPKPMLKAVARTGRQNNIQTFVSIEEHMGCGVGACLGCVVDTVNGYKSVCADGPVFDVSILKEWT
jgi:dihydroorotate dehydrogenase electron transfer subunit